MSTVSESVKTAATVSPTESEIATVAYQLWMERGSPIGSDREDWFRAEATIKNALAGKREDQVRRPSVSRGETRTESEIVAEFASHGTQGHWEVWEREWVGARWVWDDRKPCAGVSNRANSSGKAA